MQTRRQFLNSGLGSAALFSVSSSIPCFVPKSLQASDSKNNNGNILVVVELVGGNDGLNTIVPFTDDAYYRNRERIGIAEDRLFKLNDDLGWHRSLRGLNKHWDEGNVAVVQGVGYPNPNRSHFAGRQIWSTGEPSESNQFGLGWIGKGFDELETESTAPTMMGVGVQGTPLALRGRRSVASTMHSIEQCLLPQEQTSLFANAAQSESTQLSNPTNNQPDDLWSYVHRTQTTALQTSALLSQLKLNSTGTSYPRSEFARRLQLVAKLIRAEMGTRVFYVEMGSGGTGSFDTHAGQIPQHAQLLSEFGGGVGAFLDDLKSTAFSDRVVVMAFSEFGRRVKENAAKGTDHGKAGPVFLAGGKVAGGIHGPTPSLTDLDAGDLKMTVDFREVYARLLGEWLQLPGRTSDGIEESPLTLFA